MENLIELFQQFWLNLQHGQLPDVGSWNYMVMGLLIMLQGRISAVVSGIAAAAGYLNLGLIIIVAILARVVVDFFWYKLGSLGLLGRLGLRANTVQRITDKVTEDLNRNPFRLVFIAKVFSGLGVPLLITAGKSGIPLKRWLPASFIGEVVGTVSLLLFGYYATDALSKLDGRLTFLSTAGTIAIGIILVVRSMRSGKKQVVDS